MTQPPDDRTQRFDPFRDDDDSTRAMPPVPPGDADDDTRYFPFDSGDATRPVPPYSDGADDATRVFAADGTRPYPAEPDATAAMPPVAGGAARGAAAPVPPGGYGNVYGGGGGTRPPYDEYSGDEPGPERGGRRTALIVGGIVAAVLLVIVLGVVAAKALVGSPASDSTSAGPATLAPSASETLSAEPTASASPTPEFTVSAPPPEGPGPRILDASAPARVQCPDSNTQSVQISWRVAGTDRVDVSMDGLEVQKYDPNDDPVSVPFPCDGQAHKYQVTAFSNDDRQSQPRQLTVRPEQPTTAPPLFPAPTAS